MKNVNLMLVLLFISISVVGQKTYPFDKWTTKDSIIANTAKDVTYMTDVEKQIIFYCNLVKMKPELFAKTYYQRYLDVSTHDDSYTQSLMKELTAFKFFHKSAILYPDTVLTNAANFHLAYTIKRGRIQHDNWSKRSAKTLQTYKSVDENCGGVMELKKNDGLAIMLGFLIDDDYPSVGHRHSILNKKFKKENMFFLLSFGKYGESHIKLNRIGVSTHNGFCIIEYGEQ